ncbi:aminotransferase [Mesorhizobium sp. DCY119]|uniref:aminotransferase n=1 Tax=Mesorhizobium sp. DCY119 TaxID=2108445 RepID=UPI000E71C23E|nr:aminotransferase [Mesorhizobium sp. DCY119]RJG40511.1 aminotransferase [Mesorhizobium sp. DCY119]
MAHPVFEGMGTSIFESMSRLAVEHNAVNLGQGFPEGLEPQEMIEAAMQALRHGSHQYPSMMGLPALRQAVAENSRRFFGLDVDWEQEVLITSGATEALANSFLALLETGNEVIILEPAYDSYAPMIRRAGAIPVPVRLTPPNWELPREQLRSAITKHTRAIVLNNPMNPTGKVFGREELAFLAELLVEHDLIAISDEVYDHLVFDGIHHISLFSFPDVRDRVVRIGSAGKSFSLTGWKVGYVTADNRLLRPISRAHQYVNFSTPPALQAAVAVGLAMPDDYFNALRERLEQRRNFLLGGLRAAGFKIADVSATYFAVADIGGNGFGDDDLAYSRRMTMEAGVATVPMSFFYENREVTTHIRFCFAKHLATLEDAVSRLALWSGKSRAEF